MHSVLVAGPSWSQLARDIAKRFDVSYVPFSVGQFADTEVFASFQDSEGLSGKSVFLVYQFSFFNQILDSKISSCSINDQLFGLLEAVDLLRLAGAGEITILLPYLPYSRQDICFQKKHEGAVYLIGRCLRAIGVDCLYACDLHAVEIEKSYPISLQHLSFEAFWKKVLVEEVISKNREDLFCIVSPDRGGKGRAEKVANLLGFSSAFVRKKRVARDTAVAYEIIGDEIKGKSVVLIDDIVNTGCTACSASDLLFQRGALKVFGCFTHAVLSDGTVERLETGNFEKVFVTDTLISRIDYKKCKKIQLVSACKFIAAGLEDFFKEQ